MGVYQYVRNFFVRCMKAFLLAVLGLPPQVGLLAVLQSVCTIPTGVLIK